MTELETAQRRGGGGWDPTVEFLKGLKLKGMECPHALRQHPGPEAPVGQVGLGWTTRVGWEPWPESSRLHLGPGRELGAAQGHRAPAQSEGALGWILKQVGCPIL